VIAATIAPTCAFPSELKPLKRFHRPVPKQVARNPNKRSPDDAALAKNLEWKVVGLADVADRLLAQLVVGCFVVVRSYTYEGVRGELNQYFDRYLRSRYLDRLAIKVWATLEYALCIKSFDKSLKGVSRSLTKILGVL
jgi:hypothetical protein